ncbi:hypothetical protein [Lentzea flaviverrucosa]|nr:hypothetical protein [Lentzea flaviverrucosa]
MRRDSERSVVAALSGFGDPLAVAHAIVTSPLGMHRHLTLAHAVRLALRATFQGRAPGKAAGDMRDLMRLLEAQAGSLAALEDAVPWDPRVPATRTFRDKPYRLYPGMMERPVTSLWTAELVAQAVDPTLERLLGFGVADWVEVCLAHTEHVVERLAPVWPAGGEPEVGDLPQVSADEIRAARDVLTWTPLGAEATEAHRKALEWGTVTLGQLEVDLGMTSTCFGTAIAVSGPAGVRYALPLPYVTEACEAGVTRLAVHAAAQSYRAQQKWLQIARSQLGKLMHSLPDLPPAHVVQGPAGPVMLIHFGERHVLAFAVAAHIGPMCDTQAAEAALCAIAPGATVGTDAGELTLSADAEVLRVVVTASVGATFLGVTEQVGLVTMEDLAWMVKTCERADELWAFFHEQVVTNAEVEMLGWELVNTWQTWRATGQALHRAGLPPTGIMVAPHQVGDEEWELAGEQAPLEWALHRLELPPTTKLKSIASETSGLVSFSAQGRTAGALALLDPADPRCGPVVVEGLQGAVPADLLGFALNMLGTACRVMLQLRVETVDALKACGLNQVVVLHKYAEFDGEPMVLADQEDDLVVLWSPGLQAHEVENPGYIQQRLGVLITEAWSRACDGKQQAVAALAAAWPGADRVLVISAETVLNQARDLERPAPVAEWAVSQANRMLGVHLAGSGQAPGRRDRAESRTLELGIILSWLREQMAEKFVRFSASAVLNRAAVEMEAITFTREAERRQRSNLAQMPPRLNEAGEPEPEADSELAQQSAIFATLIELALVAEQQGEIEPDDIEWAHLLALAGLFVDSTTRSDALLHEMSNEVTDVSDRFEVTLQPQESTAIDMDAFNAARLRHYSARNQRPANEAERGPSFSDVLAQVDPAMHNDLGCSATTLLNACRALSAWPVSDESPTAVVSLTEVEADLVEQLGVDHSEASAALAALTLTRADLTAERVQPWKGRARDHRLLVRPLIQLSDDTVLVLPWNSSTTGRVTGGYLSDGLLPWPTSRLERYPRLRSALDQVRLQRTRVLEDEVDEWLREHGFIVRSRIKAHHAHTIGLPSLPGEIDHIAMHPDSDTMWVIDDKDLAEVFTSAEIARSVHQFSKPKGEFAKLQSKVDAVAAGSSAVAASLRVPPPRVVRGIFVTRRPSPVAYALQSPIAFVTLGELDSWMFQEVPERTQA